MADLNWQNKCLNADLMHFTIANTRFTLSLWKSYNPFDLLYYGEHFIRVDAYFNEYGILFWKNRKFCIGDLPTDNVTAPRFKEQLKVLVTKFFEEHPEIIEIYNKYHYREEISYD